MPRGELVGEAFIRVTADSTAARRNIHRDARLAGEDFSSEFGKEVEASIESDMAGARRKIADSLAKVDFSAFDKRFGSVAAATREVQREFDNLRQSSKITDTEWRRFSRTLKEWAADASVQERARADADAVRKLAVEVEKTHGIALRMNRDFDKSALAEAMHDAAVEAARFNDLLKKSNTIKFGDGFSEARVDMEKLRNGLRGVEALTVKVDRDSDSMGRSIRRAGQAGQGLFSIFGGINKTLEGIAHRGNPLVDLFVAPLRAGTQLGAMFEKLFGGALAKFTGGSRVLGVFGGLAGALGAAAIAAGVMVKAASLLSSALSLVAGMATIAASAIGGALVGAILLAASAIPAAIAGLGGIILFFADFEKQAPKSLELLKQFGKAFQAAFDKEAFQGIDTTIKRIVDALTPLATGLATNLGKAIRTITIDFADALTQPAVLANLKFLTDIVPRQVEQLGRIFTRLTTGMIGFFSAIAPYATRFLGSIEKITLTFTQFTNSAAGKTQIQAFMEKVIPLADSLWGVLLNVGRAIGGIFNAAVDGGTAGKFLGFLDDITRKFADWVNSTEGQNQIKAWLDDAYRAGQALGTLIQGIARIFGALDTSKSRDQVIKLTDGIGNFLNKTAPYLEQFLGFIDGIGDKLSGLNFQPFLDFAGEIGSFLGEVAGALKGDALAALDSKFEGFNDLADTIRDDLNPALHEFLTAIKPVVEFLGSAALKNLKTGWQGVADVIAGLALALSGTLNLITGLVTLDFDKIRLGWEQGFRSLGDLAFGAFKIALSSSGIQGILDKIFNLDAGASFDQLKTQVSDFFSGWGRDAEAGTGAATEATDGFFTTLAQRFTDTRLSVGQFFTDAFSHIDFTGILTSVETFLDNTTNSVVTWASELAVTVGGAFTTAAGAIGTFFTEVLPQSFETARLAVGQFFTDLPNTIAFGLGAMAGMIVNAVVTGWNQSFAFITEVVFPFFAALPGQLAAALTSAGSFISGWFSDQWNAAFAYFETVAIPWVQAIPGRVEAALDTAANAVSSWFIDQWNAVFAWFEQVAIPWVAAIPGRIESALDTATDAIANWFRDMWNGAFEFFEKTAIPWVRELPGRVENALDAGADFLVRWFQDAFRGLQSWVSGTFVPFVQGLPSRVAAAFVDIGSRIGGAIANQLKNIINGIISQMNSFISGFNQFSPFDVPYMRYLARGGMVSEPTIAMMGEGGKRELVVPLDRPLSQIDESVRGLAAIAQGRASVSTGPLEGSKSIVINDGAFRVTVPYSDPALVTEMVMDRIVEEVFG